MMNNRTKTALIVAAMVVVAFSLIWFLSGKKTYNASNEVWMTMDKSGPCPGGEKTVSSDDYAMEPTLKYGQKFKVILNYYACNAMKRDDLVFFRFAPTEKPVVRIVKGIPGDHFDVKLGASKMDWRAVINGNIARNPANQEYQFGSERGKPVLSLYIDARKGVLKDGELILFASAPSAHATAGTLGIASANDIVGKVVLDEDEEDKKLEVAKPAVAKKAAAAPVKPAPKKRK